MYPCCSVVVLDKRDSVYDSVLMHDGVIVRENVFIIFFLSISCRVFLGASVNSGATYFLVGRQENHRSCHEKAFPSLWAHLLLLPFPGTWSVLHWSFFFS